MLLGSKITTFSSLWIPATESGSPFLHREDIMSISAMSDTSSCTPSSIKRSCGHRGTSIVCTVCEDSRYVKASTTLLSTNRRKSLSSWRVGTIDKMSMRPSGNRCSRPMMRRLSSGGVDRCRKSRTLERNVPRSASNFFLEKSECS